MKSQSNRFGTAGFALLGMLAMATVTLAQDDGCDTRVLISATNQYETGHFDDSVKELRPCLPDGFSEKDERVSAYRLLALNYIVTDSLDEARTSIRQLLKTDSGYEADPENDPPQFAAMIEAEKPPWYTFMWQGSSAGRWAGRVAVVGTAVAVPLLLTVTNEPALPGPPALPSR